MRSTDLGFDDPGDFSWMGGEIPMDDVPGKRKTKSSKEDKKSSEQDESPSERSRSYLKQNLLG